MYKLKHANVVPIKSQALRIGLPIYEHTIPNIALVSTNNMDPIHLNATVLRAALLNSPEEVAAFLGIKVIDLYARPVPVPEKPTEEPKQKEQKKTSKESKEGEEWV